MKPIVRIVVGLVILASLAIILFQNSSPQISVTFLGMRSQALPLGLLVLLAVGAGVATGLVLLTLLRLANFLARQDFLSVEKAKSAAAIPPEPPPLESGPPPGHYLEDEWDIESPPSPWSSPESGPWPEPEAPIYDADFRVIRPPQGQKRPTEPENDFGRDMDPDEDPDFQPPPPRRSRYRQN